MSSDFFDAYLHLADDVRADLSHQSGNPARTDDAALQCLNAILFNTLWHRTSDVSFDHTSIAPPWDPPTAVSEIARTRAASVLGRFDFSLSEQDQNGAVDPAMIGRACEMAANRDAGANGAVVYTDRPEVDLMCRLALADHLTNHLGVEHHPLILDAVFASAPDQKVAADERLGQAGLWPALDRCLREITVVDPACGAGSFLIGMFHFLDDLQERASHWHRGTTESSDARRRRIVTRNLYGVDVKPWAIQATAIRLWCGSAPGGTGPSVPIAELSRHLRVGDSLVRDGEESVWDTAFVDILQGARAGFDVVIGNPPYVRHEAIADPCDSATSRSAYKARILSSIQRTLPYATDLDAKSDLYVYFAFQGLSLLNRRGTFCFLTSNAWLDARYGLALQDCLLRHCRLKLVLDNPVERSFAQADVNTVILLASAPDPDRCPVVDHTARFATLRTSFAQADNSNVVQALVQSTDRVTTRDVRVRPVSQRTLLEERLTTGSTWGGKYLRAPDIYWTMIEKGRGKLLPLAELVDYRYGIKTGAIDVFSLTREDAARWEIEPTYLKPFVRSSLALTTIEIETSDFLFSCHAPKDALEGTAALRYIEWGESRGYHRSPSVRSHRPTWYSVRGLSVDFLHLQFWDRRFWTPVARGELYCSNNFFGSRGRGHDRATLAALLNSTLHFLQIEVLGRTNQGLGVLTTYGPDLANLLILDPTLVDFDALTTAFSAVAARPLLPIADEVTRADRQALDAVVFDALGLTRGERDCVYEELVGMVEGRRKKAGTRRTGCGSVPSNRDKTRLSPGAEGPG